MSEERQWLPYFRDFISELTIDSKETGITVLGDALYGAQERFLEEVCAGLDDGIRHFCILKARQLGISTISLAMDLFWLLVHPGMQGALVTDTDGNRNKFRIILTRYFNSLPKKVIGNTKIVKHDSNNLVLSNGSVLDYLVAGTKKGGQGLGRSRALNFVHSTETAYYGDAEGIDSLKASMAQRHPDRLYIFESTAHGFNAFWDMWNSAGEDAHTQRRIFIGWWAKEDYAIERKDPRFKDWWDGAVSDDERKMLERVQSEYGVSITAEQMAWYRWYARTQVTGEGMMAQEMPSYAEEAFLSTGRSFFPQSRISEDILGLHAAGKDAPLSEAEYRGAHAAFRAYRYHMGTEFTAMTLEEVKMVRDSDLRIWEEPEPGAEYVMGVDPAYGSNDNKDRHIISVWRCYADCLVQVAEYATDIPESYHVAWAMAHLAGIYRDVVINLEIQGPGKAVMNEMRNLKQMMDKGVIEPGHQVAASVRDALAAARWYLYHRPDSPGKGYVYNWQTTQSTKSTMMNEMRDAYSLGKLRIASVPLLEEMQRVIQDGGHIEADGSAKDDRVVGAALACVAWLKKRTDLEARNRTLAVVKAEKRKAKDNPKSVLVGNILQSFYAKQAGQRAQAAVGQQWRKR